jgi:hypothetical protein
MRQAARGSAVRLLAKVEIQNKVQALQAARSRLN